MKLSVKAVRINGNKKAYEVAELLGVSLVTYSRKENGHTRFYADELAKISQLFNVPYENFFEAECLIKDTNKMNDAPHI
ncbi:MAG: helix-turn-helix transcriptional regulator [Bacillota bacterium]